jgi:origin recognition complex subunit 3
MCSDTSIAFSRFLDAGRLVNVYDWFESFAGVVEESRRQQQKLSDQDEDEDEEAEERWKIELQARFMRALHELDYMGFIKHTGRRPGHVVKTVYELPEEA